ncbi:MAG: 1,4-dihydroxy-2-naphthoate polyprenyltransferase [Anaerolinea sp.]|nr:1,4-dihydroxy-2-naphthoate polyprenyltransferase [Anaerolinea sp.]
MEQKTKPILTSFQIWWLAIRPKTLPASTAGVITGTAVAVMAGKFSLLPALAALGVGLLLQIASNLANDVFDFERGTDTSERIGPMRVTQAKLLTPRQVKIGLGVVIGLAGILGIYLAWIAGWPVIIIGLAAIASAILYTGGPYPFGYHGFGDLFVFLFFGLAAVAGTYFVQAHEVSIAAWCMAVPVGLIVVDLLVVNNLRDIHNDKKGGKNTLAVRMGAKNTRINYVVWMLIAYGIMPALVIARVLPLLSILTWLSIPAAWSVTRKVMTLEGKALNPALAGTSQLALIFALLFMAAALIYRLPPL